MKTVFIINPRTDRKKQYRLMKEIKMHFAGQRIIIEKTIRPGFATFIARKYAFQAQKEPIHIYVCGGDGTLHEVINGVANTPNVYVSIIPIGTGNDFIKSFDALSIDDFLHLENYKDPIPMDIDLLKVNGEYAINTISFGFDVQVAKYANHMKTKLPLKGIVPYYMGMLATLLHNSVQEYRLQIDDQRLSLQEYMFVVFVTPVGPYFKGGFSTNPYVIIREFDRAAPHGTGIYKVGGNYAASLRANKKAHDLGYSCEFYLDAKEKKYIDECGAANFFGIKDNTYITPKSSSILPSITNKSLMQLAEDMGIKVERRPIPEEELATFEEAGACGTAAVISPIERIDDLENGKSYVISKDGKPGPICTKLYNKLRGIQYGDEPDTHGWVTIVE